MNNNEIEFYIPNNLDIRDILIKEKKRSNYINCQIDKYHWFIDSLYMQSILNKKYDIGDFIPMNTTKMEEILDKRYVGHIKDILKRHGIIENDGEYEIGAKSIGYRLSPKYQVTHRKILQDSNSTFIENLKLLPQKQISRMDDITFYTYNQLKDLGIYVDEAIQYVEDWYRQNLLVQNPVLIKKLIKQNRKRKKAENEAKKNGKNIKYLKFTYQQMLEQMRDSYLYQIRAIDEMLWIPKRDDKGFRIHTCLTNMWKDLRQFLFLKSNPNTQLISLDCSNSQPYTLVKILLEYFAGKDLYCGQYDDVLQYIDLVTSGKLYSFMCYNLGITDKEEIADFKVEMFAKVFYSANEKGFFTKEAEVFRKFFPIVYQIIMFEKKFQYEQLSIQMQRVETSALIDIALSTLKERYGYSVWFGSIHDSIICPVDYAEEIRKLMVDAYTSVVGLAPHIKDAEKVNLVKVEQNIINEVDLPDTTPLKDLRQYFEALFNSTHYMELTNDSKPEKGYKAHESVEVISRGIDL